MWLTITKFESRAVYRISAKEPTPEEYQRDKELCVQNQEVTVSVATFFMNPGMPLIADETPAEHYHRWGSDYDGNSLFSDTLVFNSALTKKEINLLATGKDINPFAISRHRLRKKKKKKKKQIDRSSDMTGFGKCYVYKDSENPQRAIMSERW